MPTNKNVDFIIHGHTHIIKVDTVKDKTYINLGSITIPKENTKRCYGILENNMFSIYSIDDNEILKVKL
jgi:predicted phosphodiesterase